jgi:hypothetical protein
VWGLYRLLRPLGRRVERLILRALDPERADVIDAEILPSEKPEKKDKK